MAVGLEVAAGDLAKPLDVDGRATVEATDGVRGNVKPVGIVLR